MAQRLQPLARISSATLQLLCRASTGGLSPRLSPIDGRYQNETLVFMQEEVRRSISMTIQEAIDKAVKGGYHIYGSDGMDTE